MQSKRLAGSVAAIAATSMAIFLFSSHVAHGSDHQDSPLVVGRPGADITDVFAFPSPTNPKAVDLVMDVVPLIPAGTSGSRSFDPSVLYQFKIAHGPVGSGRPEDTLFQLVPIGTGPSQRFALYGTTRPRIVGTKAVLGDPIGTFPVNQTAGTMLPGGIKAFAGPRADPFFFDLFQFFTILPDRNYAEERSGNRLGTPTPSFNGYLPGALSGSGGYHCNTAPATNALTQINGGFDVLSIVLEVPRASLAKDDSPIIHLWATTSLPTRKEAAFDDKMVYQQIELLSRPAVKELFETFNDHAITNMSSPYADDRIADSINHFMTHVAGRSPAIGNVVTKVLYPNEMIADVSQPGRAAYLGVETGGATGGKFGGRGLTDDVITTSLGAVFGNTIPALGLAPDDGKENQCLTNQHVASGQGGAQTQVAYPYLAVPH